MTAKTPRAPGAYLIVNGAPDNMDGELRCIAEQASLKKINLCIAPVPDDYEISREADVTVVIYNMNRRGDQKVTANFAFRKGELTEKKVDAIVKAIGDVLPK